MYIKFIKRSLVRLIVLLARVFFYCHLNMGQALRLGQCGLESSSGEMERDVTL